MNDQEFVEYVVKALVDHPDDVTVSRTTDDLGVLLELTVNPSDMGKVIGKEGRTAKSIRTLLRVLGSKRDERVNLKIIEPEGGREMAAEAQPEAESASEEELAEEKPEEVASEPAPRRDTDLDERNPLDEIQI